MTELGSRNWLTKEEAAAFIGKNAEYYLDKWKSHPNTFFKGWNWTAALFRLEWMAYRKMYAEAVIALAGAVLFAFAASAILGGIGIDIHNDIIQLGIQVLIGLCGNGLYRKKAVRTLLKTKHMDAGQRLSFLEKKGGTSLIGVFILLGLQITILLFPTIIAALRF